MALELGPNQTVLVGEVRDQAQPYGLLDRPAHRYRRDHPHQPESAHFSRTIEELTDLGARGNPPALPPSKGNHTHAPKPLPFQCVRADRGPSGQEGVTVGIGRRIAQLYEVKVNALLDRAEDPREVLDYSYARQQELLRRIRRAVTEGAAARARAGIQEHQLRRAAARLQRQARQAAAARQDELARQALALRTATLAQARDLRAEQAALRADEKEAIRRRGQAAGPDQRVGSS
jgi:hypothetical protein